jgi:N-acetylneuraminate lyase
MTVDIPKGIYPALVTPFLPNGSINEKVLSDIIEKFLKHNIGGLYIGGSSAEVQLLSMAERKRILEIAAATAKGKTVLLAHIGCLRTEDAIELAEHAMQFGITAISSLPPFFYKFSLDELTQYYLDIVQAVHAPMIIYNAPALTGVTFNSENIKHIFDNEMICGIKYTSYDLFQMQRMVALNQNKIIINGHDEQLLSTLVIGVHYAIGSTFNIMADKFIQLWQSFEEGKIEKAGCLQAEANAIIDILCQIGIFRAIKGVMNLQGMPVGSCRRPFLPLSKDEMAQLEKLLPMICNQHNN